MYRCLVTANALSSLLDTRSGIELVAEPYRLQSEVTLCVAYSEYVNYVNSLTNDSVVCLASGTSTAIQYAVEQNPKLYSCYLKDIAFAICKELAYSEHERKGATVILPTSHRYGSTAVSYLLRLLKGDSVSRQELDSLLESTSYGTKLKSVRNKSLKDIAYALVQLSHNSAFMSELNLDYDLQ